MGLILWEKGSTVVTSEGGGEELPEASFEKDPHTGLKGISGKVTMAFNPTSACGAPKG